MKKSLDFELNLLPVISLLAVVISFLLITVVWVPIGSINIKQSVGTEEVNNGKSYSLWIQFEESGKMAVILKNSQMQTVGRTYKTKSKKRWKSKVKQMVQANNDIKSAIVAPMLTTSFEDIIQVMDDLKTIKDLDVGIAPI